MKKPRTAFVDWMKKNRWTKASLARELGVSRQTIHYFCDGRGLYPRHKIRLTQIVEKTDGSDLKSLL